jgi:hypothetical protein
MFVRAGVAALFVVGSTLAGMGYPAVAAVNTPLPDRVESFTSMYIRRRFQITDPSRIQSLLLRIHCGGGYAVRLNGKEIFRARAGGSGTPPGFQALADDCHAVENGFWVCDEIHLDPRELVQGENILALHGIKLPPEEAVDSRMDAEILALPSFDGDARPRAEEALEAFRASATGPGDAGRIAYFEARLLQYSDDPGGSLSRFLEIRATELGRPEAVLRSAECLEAIGEPQAAAKVLQDALQSGLADHDALWDAWFRLQAGHSAQDILARLPKLPPESPNPPGYPLDMSWLLAELSSRQAVRVNCGGAEHVDSARNAWGRDRFFRNGIPLYLLPAEEIESSLHDDALYATERSFRELRRPVEGYRFPLPNGSYSLKLHFTEGWFQESGKRVFDVLVQGKAFLEGYEPPCAARDIKVFELVKVTDGFLRIDFNRRIEHPNISAIEIERK